MADEHDVAHENGKPGGDSVTKAVHTVHWGFKYYLARSPELEAIKHHTDLPDVRGTLFSSKEAKQHYSKKVPPGEFCMWRRGRPSVGVVSNCQGPEIARALASISDISVYGLEVMMTKNQDPSPYLQILDSCEFILAAQMGDDWGAFSASELRARYGNRVVFYTPVYYLGLHPDITYVGKTSLRIPSPVGDYHSRIILSHFLGNRSIEESLTHFCASGFEDFGYRKAAIASEQEYRNREQKTELKTADWFFQHIASEPLLYSLNHPTPKLTQEIAKIFLSKVKITAHDLDSALTPSGLSSNIVWPIHRFWANALGLRYHSSELFHTSMYAMDLEEFAWRSYEIYKRVDFDVLAGDAAARGVLPI